MYNMAVVDQISPSLAHIARGWSYRQINEAIAVVELHKVSKDFAHRVKRTTFHIDATDSMAPVQQVWHKTHCE
jgi:hypothetical protein